MSSIYRAYVTVPHPYLGDLNFEFLGQEREVALIGLKDTLKSYARMNWHLHRELSGGVLDDPATEEEIEAWAANLVDFEAAAMPLIIGQGVLNGAAILKAEAVNIGFKDVPVALETRELTEGVNVVVTRDWTGSSEVIIQRDVRCGYRDLRYNLEGKLLGTGPASLYEAGLVAKALQSAQDDPRFVPFQREMASSAAVRNSAHWTVWHERGFFLVMTNSSQFALVADVCVLPDDIDVEVSPSALEVIALKNFAKMPPDRANARGLQA